MRHPLAELDDWLEVVVRRRVNIFFHVLRLPPDGLKTFRPPQRCRGGHTTPALSPYFIGSFLGLVLETFSSSNQLKGGCTVSFFFLSRIVYVVCVEKRKFSERLSRFKGIEVDHRGVVEQKVRCAIDGLGSLEDDLLKCDQIVDSRESLLRQGDAQTDFSPPERWRAAAS